KLRSRIEAANCDRTGSNDARFRAQLGALGHPGFSHLKGRAKASPEALLVCVLSEPDADSRVVEGLRWIVAKYADEMDFDWVVRQAKLRNLQNRLGFLLQLANTQTTTARAAVVELEKARLFQEATLCWDSMPAATREWMLRNRTPLAQHWR